MERKIRMILKVSYLSSYRAEKAILTGRTQTPTTSSPRQRQQGKLDVTHTKGRGLKGIDIDREITCKVQQNELLIHRVKPFGPGRITH